MVSRPNPADLLAEFPERCHSANLLVTLPRQVVYESLIERTDHPTADMVYKSVHERAPQISRSTVFRILDSFASKGLIFKVMHPGSAARYDGVADGHAHLVCTECGRIYDWLIPSFGLNDVARDLPDGFQVRGLTVCYQGICRQCQIQGAACDSENDRDDGKEESSEKHLSIVMDK
ncbi:MAG: transcriptional repressor [Planctomycetia bacterium]|nr:transcriptional repressor [Planctomycetia bacterium]